MFVIIRGKYFVLNDYCIREEIDDELSLFYYLMENL